MVERAVPRAPCGAFGLLDLDAPVAANWPEFAAAGKASVLVRHLLSHPTGRGSPGCAKRTRWSSSTTEQAAIFSQLAPVPLAALTNPVAGAREANTAAWRAAEIPAANGHGTARAIAALYGIVAGRGSYGTHRVLSPEAAERVREGQGACRDLVLGTGFKGETEIGLGLWLSGSHRSYGPNPRAVGHDGFGGSCGLADPEAGVSLGYVMNRMGPHIADDPRKTALVDALCSALRGRSGTV
ncbi:serine hydrolase domain-containing protein [Streptomyces sp. NPDC047070]|uniref:serine hydrolase domain-containing protein n=1 Tax=Streptomyces sp. NPDC047070 TaxID=3154923 RepID=UPI003456D858